MARAPWRIALAACLLILASSCAPHSSRPPCPAGQLCLFIGNGEDPEYLDPSLSQTTWETEILDDLMVGLVQNDANDDPVPGIATKWETSPDGLVWTFHLRDAQWSDGLPVTADDFVLGMQRVVDPKMASQVATLLYVVKNAEPINAGKAPLSSLGVKALDPRTLQITLEHPAPYLLQLAKHTVMMPTPRQAFAKWGDAWAQPGHYVSDGPYLLVDWRQNDHITAVKNPRFYDAATVCIDRIQYYPAPDKISAERRVRRGELDMNMQNGIAMRRVAYLRQPGQIPAYVHTHTYLANEYLSFNVARVPALKDRRVRQALTMAVDRDFIVDQVRRGGEVAANTFVPPGVADYPGAQPPYWASWPLARRQAQARELLRQAGYGPGGKPLKLTIYLRASTDPAEHDTVVQANWKAIGVTADFARSDAAVAYDAFRTGNFQVANPGWVADYDDPMTFLDMLMTNGGQNNYGRYSNPAYDALLDKANTEPNAAKRAAYMAQAEHLMLEDAPIVPLFYNVATNLVNPRITGWADNLQDFHPSRYLCFADAKRQPGH